MNYPYIMYNYMRCLVNSVKYRKEFFTPIICNGTATYNNKQYANIPWFWNDAACKRFYCQNKMQNVNIPMNPDVNNIDVEQQKLDEFLSNPDNRKLFQVIELEVDVLRHDAEKVPKNIKAQHWLELLNLTSRMRRRKYLYYLFLNEKSAENRKIKKEQKRAEWLASVAEEKQAEDTNEMKYGLCHNSLFLRIYEKTMSHYYDSKLIWNMLFEPKLVIDCGYEDHMNNVEIRNCAKQLTLAFAAHRNHENPMFLYFCNLNEKGSLKQQFQRNMSKLSDVDFPAVVTSQSYLDLFPKDQLVYLTPHCRTDLVEYDPDMVYIIGALIDKWNPQPLSLAKAKKEGLRMAKFPVDRYLDWGSGSIKSFTINQALSIMLDLKCTKNWKKAFQHVPTRKLREARERNQQRKLYLMSKLIERTESPEMKIKEKLDEIQTPMKSSKKPNFTYVTRKKR